METEIKISPGCRKDIGAGLLLGRPRRGIGGMVPCYAPRASYRPRVGGGAPKRLSGIAAASLRRLSSDKSVLLGKFHPHRKGNNPDGNQAANWNRPTIPMEVPKITMGGTTISDRTNVPMGNN